jgi:hypothetical protein
MMTHRRFGVLAAIIIAATPTTASFAQQSHNVILFVADGLRPRMVNEQTAPALAGLMKKGVHFTNTHAMFPTFTTPNAASMATGHKVGDTGNFGNTIDAGFAVPGAGDSLTPFLENDPVLGDVDEHFAADYLNQETVMRAARAAGLSTATIGKLAPALIFDHTERSGEQTIVIDDSTVPVASRSAPRCKSGLGPRGSTCRRRPAAKTARPAISRRRARSSPTRSSKSISSRQPPRSSCPSSRSAGSRSC